MGLFDHFPYTNFHELNLAWILEMLKEIDKTMDEFVAINALKYADPIQWNIVSQYEKNTIVIDPLTGTAYISVQPVPAGVSLTNTDYWSVVFDLGQFVVKAAQNFCTRYEEATTLTATFPSLVNDWLIWGDTLYYALVNITAGDTYVPDSNIKQFTVEDVVGHLQDLNTTDKSNLVAAINDVLVMMSTLTGDLDDLNTTDKSNLVAAINDVLVIVGTVIGDLNDLVTTDKSSIVAAINEVYQKGAVDHAPVNVLDHGVVGNGLTDDTAAIQALVNDYNWIYVPDGAFILITSTVTISRSIKISGSGSWSGKFINGSSQSMFNITGRGVIIEGLQLECSDYNTGGVLIDIGVGQGTINNCHFDNYNNGIRMNNTSMQTVSNCFFEHGSTIGSAIIVGETQYCSGITLSGIRIFGTDLEHPYCGILVNYADGVDIISAIINRTVYSMIADPVDGGFIHALRCNDVLFDFADNGVSLRCSHAASDIYNVSFNSCWFAADATQTALNISGTAGSIQNITVQQCEFIGGFYGVNLGYSMSNILITGCLFTDISNAAINMDGNNDIKAIVDDIFISASLSAATPITPLNGVQITGNNANRQIFLNRIICTTATGSAIYVEYRDNIYLLNSIVNSGNYYNIGNTVNEPTGAPDGVIYFNTDNNQAYFMINGQLRTWSADKIMKGAMADLPATPESGLLYYVTDRDEWRYSDTNNTWQKITKIKAGLLANRYTTGIDYGDRYFATDENRWYTYGSQGWYADTQSGSTADRPVYNLIVGTTYFDTTLNQPIWWTGSGWVDATGTSV